MSYIGVRMYKERRRTRYEARIPDGNIVGYFDSSEEAARCVNGECAKRGLPTPNKEIAPTFRRIRCGDGAIVTLCACGTCGQELRTAKTGLASCCGRTYAEPANADSLPVETSDRHRKEVRRVQRRVEKEKRLQNLHIRVDKIQRTLEDQDHDAFVRGKSVREEHFR